MATEGPTYPILVDTDALIAVANSPLWELISEHIGLTTTNVCQQELRRHRDQTRSSAPEGSRPYRLHHGSDRVLDALDDDETPLTRVVAAEAGRDGVQVNAVCPGFVDAGIAVDFFEGHDDPDQVREAVRRDYPLGRLGESEETAEAILWQGSEKSSWVTVSSWTAAFRRTDVVPVHESSTGCKRRNQSRDPVDCRL